MQTDLDPQTAARTKRPIHIAMVDDHAIVLDGMVCLFDVMPGHRVVHSATNAEDFMTGLAAHAEVDIALVDLQMEGTDGFAVLERLRTERPEIRCIAFSFNDDRSWVRKAMAAGARGYVLKDTDRQTMGETIHEVLTNGFQYSDLIRESMAHAEEAPSKPKRIDRRALPRREREFLEHLLRPGSASFKEIAVLMGVSLSAVEGYFRYFSQHFDVHSRADLVKLAMLPPSAS